MVMTYLSPLSQSYLVFLKFKCRRKDKTFKVKQRSKEFTEVQLGRLTIW